MWGDDFVIVKNSEAHKAFYLFLNPEARVIFEDGSTVIGKNIKLIEPAWNEIMGWHPTHKLTGDDWGDINRLGIKQKMQEVTTKARDVAVAMKHNPQLASKKLSEAFEIIGGSNLKQINGNR